MKVFELKVWEKFVLCKGACKYYISALVVGGGSEENAYIAYVKDQNSYSPENGFEVCAMSLHSLVKGHI